jgi:hypothetical protein
LPTIAPQVESPDPLERGEQVARQQLENGLTKPEAQGSPCANAE